MRRSITRLLVVIPLLVAGCGGGSHHTASTSTFTTTTPQAHTPPYTTVAPPSLKGTSLKAPAGCPATRHIMGGCLPHPVSLTPKVRGVDKALAAGITGPDLSNNDPVGRLGIGAIAAHSRFMYLKSTEGTGFTDSTAGFMTAFSKAFHLPVGGYDFQHVCGPSPEAEADHFIGAARAQGLLGPGTLPPAADSEYGNGSCGGRSWIQRWVNEVYRIDGHVCPIDYTGAWWWNPNIGAFWAKCAGHDLLSWISGYGVSYPALPASLAHLDFWQFSDHGYNGYSNADLSVWRHSESAFRAFAHAAPPVDAYAKYPKAVRSFRLRHSAVHASEYHSVRTWDRAKCRAPARSPVCTATATELRLLLGRINYVASHRRTAHGWVKLNRPRWGESQLGSRAAGIRHRVNYHRH